MRIGVNVPDDLLNRVKRIKPEVNVSQICRAVLEERVKSHERAVAQVAADDANEQVFRLAKSLATSLIEPDWEALALEDARDWINQVQDAEWKLFVYQYDYLKRNNRDTKDMVDVWSAGIKGKGIWSRIHEHSDWFIEQYEAQFETGSDTNLQDRARALYAHTWLGYVLEKRSKLEKCHREEYEKMLAERRQFRRSLIDAEVESPPDVSEKPSLDQLLNAAQKVYEKQTPD